MSETQAVTILSRRFPGKRAFITGAGSGLGRAIATELAAKAISAVSRGWALGTAEFRRGLVDELKQRGAQLESAAPYVQISSGGRSTKYGP